MPEPLTLDPILADVEEPQKKKRGRKPKVEGDVAPKPEASRAPRSYERDVAELLVPLNEILKAFPVTSADALSDDELARAVELGDKAARKHARFRKLVKQSQTASLWGGIALLGMGITLRIAVNHKLLPPDVMERLKSFGSPPPEPAPEPEQPPEYMVPTYPNGQAAGIPTVAAVWPSGR